MNDVSFPKWSGPFVGMLVGTLCALRAGGNGAPLVYIVIGGAILGGLAGCSIYLLEPNTKGETPTHTISGSTAEFGRQSGIVGRFLAVSGLLFCWTPFLGLVLNLAGVAVNWKSSDWARKVSICGAIVAFIVTAIVLVLILVSAG